MNSDQQHRRTPLSTIAQYELEREEQEQEESAGDRPLKVLVVDRRGGFASDIERAARSLHPAPEVVVISQPTHVVEEVTLQSPDVVLVAPDEMSATGLRRMAQVHRSYPRTVIALTQGAIPISMTAAAACGASEVVAYPASPIKLRNALGRICATAEIVRGERVVIREVPAPAPPPPLHAGAAVVGTAKVFTVTSPTGGCGKTFFATNIAAYLAGVTGGRVLLVDLDLQFGEVSLALGLRPRRTIAELINEDNLVEAFPEYLVDHSAGFKVLSAPADPFAAELVGPREATQVLEAARALFDYVVVDTPPSLNEVVLAAFDQSRYLIVMATLDVPSLRNLKVFLETIDRLKLPAENVSCVLNKAEPDNGIDVQELLRVYPGGFAAVLPYSKEVSRSLNVGQPVLMVDPRAEISQRLLEAGAKLVPSSEVTNPAWGVHQPARSGWPGHRRRAAAAAAVAPPPTTYPAPVPTREQAPLAPVRQQAAAAAQIQWPAQPETQLQEPPAAPTTQAQPAAMADPRFPAPAWTQGTQAPAPAPRRNWLSRLFGRTGRHSVEAPWTGPPAAYQMPMTPPQGTPGEQPRDSNFLLQALSDTSPAEQADPRTLVFAGSHDTPAEPKSPRRRRPTESQEKRKEAGR